MARSVKKGPFVDPRLAARVAELNRLETALVFYGLPDLPAALETRYLGTVLEAPVEGGSAPRTDLGER